ncbi:hypothetical protein GCM10010166_64260 [Couchioplanes caeruleus subsp. azureus]|nr:hypothetical protein GCM10010166_64260 [Couchioplanes caeruleus subsp. azureus]
MLVRADAPRLVEGDPDVPPSRLRAQRGTDPRYGGAGRRAAFGPAPGVGGVRRSTGVGGRHVRPAVEEGAQPLHQDGEDGIHGRRFGQMLRQYGYFLLPQPGRPFLGDVADRADQHRASGRGVRHRRHGDRRP